MSERVFMAYILVGAGGCWHNGTTIDGATKAAIKQLKRDWGHLFKFKKGDEIKVNIYELTDTGDSGVCMDERGVTDIDSGEQLDRLELRTVTL